MQEPLFVSCFAADGTGFRWQFKLAEHAGQLCQEPFDLLSCANAPRLLQTDTEKIVRQFIIPQFELAGIVIEPALQSSQVIRCDSGH